MPQVSSTLAPSIPTAADRDQQWRQVVTHAAELYGTPCYITRAQPIEGALAALEQRLDAPVRSWLSFKTHPLPQLASWWTRTGRGVEVVSETELATALRLGCRQAQLAQPLPHPTAARAFRFGPRAR